MGKQKGTGIGIGAIGIIVCFILILAIPGSREIFKTLSASHPFLMGFLKFGVLATTGEVLSLRLAKGSWQLPDKLWQRAVIWGLIGVAITFMMKIFSAGVDGLLAAGVLPAAILRPFYISAIMNLTFGPAFMAFHKCTDQWLNLKSSTGGKVSRSQVIAAVDWTGFTNFTLFKTIPFFWIPAHTVTFMLPAEYQVAMAALLSVALGIILNLNKN